MKMAILGLGWLGEALAQYFLQQGHQVSGTYRTNISFIPDCFPLVLPLQPQTQFPKAFLEAEVLVLTLPPSASSSSLSELYEDFFVQLNPYSPAWKRLILCSSISMYGEKQGDVDESSLPQPDGARGEAQLKLEQTLMKKSLEVCSLRLGGLIGPDRHPIKTLQGKMNLAPGFINLIDQLDILRAIEFLLKKETLPQTVNLVSPEHPLKKDYYQKLARQLHLLEPQYRQTDMSTRRVHPKLLNELGFTFKNASLQWSP